MKHVCIAVVEWQRKFTISTHGTVLRDLHNRSHFHSFVRGIHVEGKMLSVILLFPDVFMQPHIHKRC